MKISPALFLGFSLCGVACKSHRHTSETGTEVITISVSGTR